MVELEERPDHRRARQPSLKVGDRVSVSRAGLAPLAPLSRGATLATPSHP